LPPWCPRVSLERGSSTSIHGRRNLFSGSGAVVNWPDVLVAESNPAIQITNNAASSHAGMGADSVHPELRGTVVVYLDNDVPAVDPRTHQQREGCGSRFP